MQKGFTLTELMIVIAIIGILAAVALPAYQDYIARSQVAEALSLASGLKSAVVEHYSAKGICPYNFSGRPADMTSGIPAASLIAGKYVAQVQTGQANNFDSTILISAGNANVQAVCTIAAYMKTSGIAKAIQGKKLYLHMAPTSGSFVWKCSGGSNTTSIANKYLPSSCQ